MRKILLVLSLLMALCAPSFSADVITLDEAIQSAMENNTDMEKARLNLQQDLRTYSNVASYIPNLALTGSANIAGSALGSTTLGLAERNWSTGASFSAGISMELGTSLIGTTAVNNAMRTVSELTYAASVDSVEQSVTTSNFALSSSKRSMESTRISLESAKRSLESVKERYDAGLATTLDVNNAEIAVLNYEFALKQLEDAYTLSEESFRTLTGIEGEIVVEEFPEVVYLNLPTAEDLYASYANNTTTIRALNAAVSASEAALTSTRLQTTIPSVNLALNYNFGGSTFYNNNTTNDLTDGASATLSFTIPISSYIPGSSTNNTLRNAQDDVAISKVELKAGQDGMLSGLRNTVNTLNQTKENVNINSRQLELAQKSYELSLESYNAGLITLTELQTAQDSLNTAQLNLINQEATYVQNAYNLAYTLNIDYETLVSQYAENGV